MMALDKLKSFIVKWSAAGCTGTFRYLVVADSLEEAKRMWEVFVSENDKLLYFWKKAQKGVCGFITWDEHDTCDKQRGCYDLGYHVVKTGSDHLWD